MKYKKGFKIKPLRVERDGSVVFTDGTNEVGANEKSCKAYGYKYKNGACFAYQQRDTTHTVFQTTSTIKKGSNTISQDTENSMVIGTNNETKGGNRQVVVNGEDHIVNRGVENSAIIAGKGTTSRSLGEAVLTGHYPNKSNYGQCSIVMLNCNTTDNTETSMTSQITTSDATGVPLDYIVLPKNSIVGIEMYLTRLEIGGSSGTAGNYSYRRQQSCVQIDNAASGTLVNFNTKNIAKIGVNGSYSITGATIADEDGVNQFCLSVNVADRNNVNNSWSAILYLHITSTNTIF